MLNLPRQESLRIINTGVGGGGTLSSKSQPHPKFHSTLWSTMPTVRTPCSDTLGVAKSPYRLHTIVAVVQCYVPHPI